MNPARRDSGQIGVLAIALTVVVLVATQGLVRVGSSIADRARAQSVADAVALAVASDRSDLTPTLVDDQRARVLYVTERDGGVTVRVRVGEASATARATTNW